MARVNDNRNKARSASQKSRILNVLLHGMKLTALDGLYMVGTMKLATRISELRKDGWEIEDKWEEVQTADGKTARVKAYYMNPANAN